MASTSGLGDWKIQRLTAVILGLYVGLLLSVWPKAPLTPMLLSALFEPFWMKSATSLAWLALTWHAWIGVWTVTTDYISSVRGRLLVHAGVIIALGVYALWCFQLVWGKV